MNGSCEGICLNKTKQMEAMEFSSAVYIFHKGIIL